MNDRLLQFAVFAVSVAGYVALALKGEATAEYVTLVGPVLAVVILKTHLGNQDRVLGEIHDNTNGKLDRRIERAVARAMRGEEGT